MRPYSANNIGLGNTLSASARSLVISGECASDILRAGRWTQLKPHSHCLGRALDLLQHASHRAIAVCTWMPEDSHAGELWHDLSEQL